MDGADNSQTTPIQLSQQQTELIRELTLITTKFNFGQMFEGAIHALRSTSNPEALPQAAHSLRELMEKLEGVKGIPVTDKAVADGEGSLGEKTRELHNDWKVAKKKSGCLSDNTSTNEIDKALRNLLIKVTKFFDWFEKNPKFLTHKARGVVKGLDPLAAMLPQAVQDAQAQEWRALKDYFIGVSHHGNVTSLESMEATVACLEQFLYSRIAPVKAQNQNKIEKLIEEIEHQ